MQIVSSALVLALCACSATATTPVYSMGYIWRNTTEKTNAPVAHIDLSQVTVPQSLDWRTKGVVTPSLTTNLNIPLPHLSIFLDLPSSKKQYQNATAKAQGLASRLVSAGPSSPTFGTVAKLNRKLSSQTGTSQTNKLGPGPWQSQGLTSARPSLIDMKPRPPWPGGRACSIGI